MSDETPPPAGSKIEAARHSLSMDYFEPATVTGHTEKLGQTFVQFTYDTDGLPGEHAWPGPAIRPMA